MIKSNKEVTFKTRGTYFLYRNPQNLKLRKMFFMKFILKEIIEIFFFLGKLHSAEKTQSGQLSQN